MKSFLRNNGLSIVFILMFLVTICCQAYTGRKVYNDERSEKGLEELTMGKYLTNGHFIEATFENWESEFLQMALFVSLSGFLFQKGSVESKDPEGEEETDREPNKRRKNAPWPVKKGGIALAIYQKSLSLSLFLLYLLSFGMHWYGSLLVHNEKAQLAGKATMSAMEYLGSSQLWFESFENWQSEFLSVFAIVVLSIFLRDKGSAQSKPVDAANSDTGG